MNRPRIGVNLPPHYSTGADLHVVARSRMAEALGFDDLWITDHLFFHQRMSDFHVLSSMAAAVTARIQICFGVIQAPMRQPVQLAKFLGALAAEAGERVLVGLGVGGDYRPEWNAVGIDVRERGARLDEMLEFLPDLLAGRPVAHRGRFYDFEVPALFPAPTQPPPIWIGARLEQAIKRAARVDGFVAQYRWPAEMSDQIAQLRDAAQALGRPAPSSGIALVASVVGDDATARRRVSEFLRSVYGLAEGRAEKRVVGGVAQLRDLIAGYAEAGVDRVAVTLIDEPEESWESLAKGLM